MPSMWCERCGAWIQGPVNVIEVSRIAQGVPEMTRYLLCSDCGSAVTCYLLARPEVAALEPVGSK